MPRENLRFLFFCAALLRAVDASPADISLEPELEDLLGAIARGEDTRAFELRGKGFEVHGPLANDVFIEAIDEVANSVDAWTDAGERYDVAVREVVADSYRRHRAATMLQPVFG
jgi:glutamine synthetase type III